MDIVKKEIEMTIDEKFQAIEKYKKNLDDYFINFGELLSDIKRTKAFRMKGYKTFREFIEDEYNINGGFATKLINLYELYIKELDMDEASVREIGMEKLHVIKPLVKDVEFKVVEEWLETASSLPASELKEKVKEVLQKDKPDKTMKDVLVEQYLERMTTFFNCSIKELNYKLAVYFQDQDLEEIKHIVKQKQRLYEESNQL